jgi:hypothetical protein
LPRDLPIDEQTMLAIFGRAFNVSVGEPEAGKETLTQFAEGWLKFITELPPSSVDMDLMEIRKPAAPTAGAAGASFPGGGSSDGGDR